MKVRLKRYFMNCYILTKNKKVLHEIEAVDLMQMVNGLSAVYSELNDGQLATVEELVESLYPNWFDTKTILNSTRY